MGENHFRKCFSVFTGVWLRMENAFSGNAFQLSCVGSVNWFPFLFYLQILFSGKQRESWVRGREEEEPARRERERGRERERTISRRRAVNRDLAFATPRRRSRSRLRAINRNLAFAPSIAISPSRRQSRSREAPRKSQSTKHRADHEAPHPDDCEAPHPAFAPLSLHFSQFDRIWWFFFLGFVCVSVLRNEWFCNICLATEKLWENVTGFDGIWWFFFLGLVCVSVLRNEWYYIFV